MKKVIQGFLIAFILLYGIIKNVDLIIPKSIKPTFDYIYLTTSLLMIILMWFLNFKNNGKEAILKPNSLYGIFWSILFSVTYFYNLKTDDEIILILMLINCLLTLFYIIFSPLYRKAPKLGGKF
jgi:hypothetical protein